MKIAYYRGVFDPFHNGHKEVLNKLYSNKLFDKIEVFIDYSGKEGSVNPFFDYKTRLRMVQDELDMMFGVNNERISISKLYLDYISIIFNPNGSTLYGFLLDNILSLRDDEIYLVFGSDTNFSKFYNYELINEMKFIKYFIINRCSSFILEYIPKEKTIISDIYNNMSNSELIRQCLVSLNSWEHYSLDSYYDLIKIIDNVVDDYIMLKYVIPSINKDIELYVRYKSHIKDGNNGK